jgi:hypothetical protein
MAPLTAVTMTRLSTVITAIGHKTKLTTCWVVRPVRGSSCRRNTSARYTGAGCDRGMHPFSVVVDERPSQAGHTLPLLGREASLR